MSHPCASEEDDGPRGTLHSIQHTPGPFVMAGSMEPERHNTVPTVHLWIEDEDGNMIRARMCSVCREIYIPETDDE